MELHTTTGPLRHCLHQGNTGMRALLVAWVCMGGLSDVGAAEQQPAIVSAVVMEEELDEAVVKGTALWKLRQDIVKTEEQFYRLFNELNKNDDYDMHCQVQAALGSRIQRRVCRLAFYEDAEADAAQAMLRGEDVIDPQLVLLERESDYRKSALAIINGDRRLLRLARERQAAEKKYNAELKRRFENGRWVSF